MVQTSLVLQQVILPLQQLVAQLEQQTHTSADVLNLLYHRWAASVEPARARLSYLLAAAAKPFFARVAAWIAGDALQDPFDELFVSEASGENAVAGSVVLRAGVRHLPRFVKRETALLLLECGQVVFSFVLFVFVCFTSIAAFSHAAPSSSCGRAVVCA